MRTRRERRDVRERADVVARARAVARDFRDRRCARSPTRPRRARARRGRAAPRAASRGSRLRVRARRRPRSIRGPSRRDQPPRRRPALRRASFRAPRTPRRESRRARTSASLRMPPPVCTGTSTAAQIARSAARFSPVPNAPSRSTTCNASRARGDERARARHGIAVVARLARGIAVQQPHATAAAQIDRGNDRPRATRPRRSR